MIKTDTSCEDEKTLELGSCSSESSSSEDEKEKIINHKKEQIFKAGPYD